MRRLQEAKTLLPTSGHRAKVLATQSLAGALAPRALEMGTVTLGKEDPGREKSWKEVRGLRVLCRAGFLEATETAFRASDSAWVPLLRYCRPGIWAPHWLTPRDNSWRPHPAVAVRMSQDSFLLLCLSGQRMREGRR